MSTLATPELMKLAMLQLPHTMAVDASGGRWKPYPYLKLIGRLIAEAVREGNQRIIVNLPPRHGKSEFIARWVPLWFLENMPEKRIIVAAHNVSLAKSHGRFVRNEFERNPYFTTKLSEDSAAAQQFNTTQGGGMYCAGVGTGIMGFGGDLIIIDDPYAHWADAHSETVRREVIEWYDNTSRTRCEPNASIVILHQRMHVEDLTGEIMAKQPERWKQIVLPAIAEDNDPIGRKPGEALCPKRYDIARLIDFRKAALGGEYGWNAMYQQRPMQLESSRAYRRYCEDHKDEGVKYDPRLPLQISFDFNVNPGMYAEVGQYDAARDQLTTVEEVCGVGMDLIECLQGLLPIVKSEKWPEIQVFGDASGNSKNENTGHSNYESIRYFFTQHGVNISLKIPASNGPIVDRLGVANDCLADMVGVQHYRVHPRCTRLITDFERVKCDKNGHPIKTGDESLTHAGDSWSYRVLFQRPIGGPIIQKTGAFVFG